MLSHIQRQIHIISIIIMRISIMIIHTKTYVTKKKDLNAINIGSLKNSEPLLAIRVGKHPL